MSNDRKKGSSVSDPSQMENDIKFAAPSTTKSPAKTSPRGGRKRPRVVIYTRSSNSIQTWSTVKDQLATCREFLATSGFAHPIVTHIHDEGLSGSNVPYRGLHQLLTGISQNRWDVLLCEDFTRLIRNLDAGTQVIELAISQGMQVCFVREDVEVLEKLGVRHS